ncbi:MAG: hypothetical protein COU81_02305 [Candidatus Portnoybacteria bacterium CG10_big_fil_rev_8_21_14_0_10_36_7]|uniref:AAA+ ATPase domain-containing protein n=1 Tax=Candidatus Portnoybacteria bacterium CG10_big_fil_rev_8_21_14_0_10_36_7 TaxID=1974812 RepID=A0A2M8KDZ8_9BACT|nr:MAG: hypothetical protein COU81_02305 [Candidatus Portnoybacteria bacterium CG10_big_fil_rev_8_21_14_0_10_36_7]
MFEFILDNSIYIFVLIFVVAVGLIYFVQKRSNQAESGAFFKPSKFGSKTPMLDRFSRDLTHEAKIGKLDPLVGRHEEIRRIIQILSRRTKNNVILVGQAGTGKTALAEGLALEIASGKVPEVIKTKRILALNLGGMLAGTQYRGEFEQRMKMITDEISASGRSIILFIDEIHNLSQAGEAQGAIGAANLLKPALARGDVQAVGATTVSEYFKYITKDTSLERRFQPVMVKESTAEETVQILMGLRKKYEDHHKVHIPDEIIKTIVQLAGKYLSDRYFPDKAVDLMDEAASKVRMETTQKGEGQDWPILTPKNIEDIIFIWSRDVDQIKKEAKILEDKIN